MLKVKSSAISFVDYDPKANLLTVQFTSNRRYSYRDVPRSVYEALLAAESKGEFVNGSIKPRYAYVEATGNRR